MYKGTERITTVEVRVDSDLVTTWTSSGTTDDSQSIALTEASGSIIEITGVLAETEWLSIIEVRFFPSRVVPTDSVALRVLLPYQCCFGKFGRYRWMSRVEKNRGGYVILARSGS